MAINRTELISAAAADSGLTQKQIAESLDAVFAQLEKAVAAGEKVTISGWLGVERTSRAARTGRNPKTGEEVHIPAGFGVKISAGSKLKAAASGS